MKINSMKVFCLILTIVIIATQIIVPAYAEDVIQSNILKIGVNIEAYNPISTSPIIYNQGEEVIVKISVEQNTGISFLYFDTFFNADAFEYVSHESAKLFGDMESIRYQENDGKFVFFVNLSDEIKTVTGDLFTITFKTKNKFCGDAQIITKLHQDQEANCAVASTIFNDKNIYVPFESNTINSAIHSIVKENTIVIFVIFCASFFNLL